MTNDRPTEAPAFQLAPLGRTPKRKEQSATLWAMTRAERIAAMRAGVLSMQQCCEWAARRPHEVPLVNDEFEFIAAYDAERHND